MTDFYLTFGSGHTRDQHPHIAVDARPDGWVTIETEQYEDARAAALYLCGIHWCWLYIDSNDIPPRPNALGRILDSFISPTMRWRYFPAGELARYYVKATRLPQDDVILDVDLVSVRLGTLERR